MVPLMVTSFQYLVRKISAADDNWPMMVRNLYRDRLVRKKMTIIRSRERAEPWVYGVSLWIVYLGSHPPHGKGPGVVPGPGGATADGATPMVEN